METPLAPTTTPTDQAQMGKARRLASAFLGVFGDQDRRRSSDQRLVWEHLRKVGCQDELIFKGDKNGTYDPLAAAQRDGARSIYLIIERQLRIAIENQAPKKKTEVKKS